MMSTIHTAYAQYIITYWIYVLFIKIDLWLNPRDGRKIHWGAQKLASIVDCWVVSAKKLHISGQNRLGHAGYKRQAHFGMMYAFPVLIEPACERIPKSLAQPSGDPATGGTAG